MMNPFGLPAAAHPASTGCEVATSPLVAAAAQSERAGSLRFLAGAAFLYLLLTTVVVLTVDRFWSANWDVEIFLGAARSFFDGGSPFDLYERSRADFFWPYPYPPLYAMLLAPFIWLVDQPALTAIASWGSLLAVRLPVVLADIGIAALLGHVVAERSRSPWLGRFAAGAWLFTPILFYQTAIQAHQESVWLLPTLAAYALLERHGAERLWRPALLLTLAIAFKQSAVIYAIPFGFYLISQRRWADLFISAAIFALIFGGIALPFALYSGDFVYMVFRDVPNMPVQTQSWILWLLMLEPFLIDQTRSTFPLIRYASAITLAAAAVLALVGRARGQNWYAIGLVLTLGFFLLSQKVMAYHYPMLVPWLLAAWLPARRLRLVSFVLVWVTWIVVSPYFAPWADPDHLPLYAILGTLNSLIFLALLVVTLREGAGPQAMPAPGEDIVARNALEWGVLVGLGFLLASVARPLTLLATAPGAGRLVFVVGLLLLVLALTLGLWVPATHAAIRYLKLPAVSAQPRLRRPLVLASLLFVPLFFTWFTMTTEVTAVIEQGIQAAWGL